MSDNNNHPLGEAPWFHVILSTGLGIGFVPGAPGTAGAFLAMAIWYALYLLLDVTTLFFVSWNGIGGKIHVQWSLTNLSVPGCHCYWRPYLGIKYIPVSLLW